MARTRRNRGNGSVLVHRIFGESFYENLAALMDQQIAEMMKEPEFRSMVEEFNYRMFETMARIAAKQMKGGRR
ncbi:MAG: hypothetical protein L0323_04655 [Planctomycetes bacterium]|nr:hypothetical protein [Planctomycetota bacterium]